MRSLWETLCYSDNFYATFGLKDEKYWLKKNVKVGLM